MVARVTTLQLQPGKCDEFLRMFQDVLAPLRLAQPGFGGSTLLADSQLGKVVVVGLWDSEADLLASDHADYQTNLAEISGLLVRPPLCEAYDVSIQVELNEQGMARIRGI
jgi:heme-degrading monooxygenase HmoA